MSYLSSKPSAALSGKIIAPGDKSISHRSLILGALASGKTRISGILMGQDVLNTAKAMQAFGADISQNGDIWEVQGLGPLGLQEPSDFIDFGNAGTGVRLTMGVSGSFPIKAFYTGDSSLRGRPMARILDPLAQMGVRYEMRAGGLLPCVVIGTDNVTPITYFSDKGSAQVKSAILLCGLRADGVTTVIEAKPSRDHTENMLRGFGVDVEVQDMADGRHASVRGKASLTACDVAVPGDPSSAAFLVVAALIIEGSDITIENVMMNPLRAGIFTTLIEMGADLTIYNERVVAGEKIADLRARHSALKGIVVPPERAPSMIDEYPILAIAAAFATGETVMEGIGELRVKESDRIRMTFDGLIANGVEAEEGAESLRVMGKSGAKPKGGASVTTHGDHRIAMSFLILGMASQSGVKVDEAEMIGTSFPNFVQMMTGMGGEFS
ncbi:MAG: 3-phosphoshikimate 1-carboxyvinyltransferase [Hyphomonadaceae bacterium]|nr:MAG: 3-phosphoshikimate 1-carboxyvinyltransferase [Hyphomonadaceae bacterium]